MDHGAVQNVSLPETWHLSGPDQTVRDARAGEVRDVRLRDLQLRTEYGGS